MEWHCASTVWLFLLNGVPLWVVKHIGDKVIVTAVFTDRIRNCITSSWSSCTSHFFEIDLNGLTWDLDQVKLKSVDLRFGFVLGITSGAFGVDSRRLLASDIRDGNGSELLCGGVPSGRDRGIGVAIGVGLVVWLVVLVLLRAVLVATVRMAIRGPAVTTV